MSELAAAEADRHLQLVAFIEELRGRSDLRVDVVVVDLGRDPDLLPGDGLLLLLRILGLLLEVVAVLPEVEDLAHRRLAVRRDLDEVVALFLRFGEGTGSRNDAQRFTVRTDEADRGNADHLVDPQFGRGYRATPSIGVSAPLPVPPLPVEGHQLERVYHRAM